jgi:hypothetical protein
MEGLKWYGVHLGPFKVPAKEDDPRTLPPNFYYDQEDYLRARVAAGAKWFWSGWRPNPIIGYATGNPMNILTVIAVYGSICKELGLPFRYPGSKHSFDKILEVRVSRVLCLCTGVVFIGMRRRGAWRCYGVGNNQSQCP